MQPTANHILKPYGTIDTFDALVYGPMTLVILGFTEAASRRKDHILFYALAAAVVCAIVLAEVGWSANGSFACGKDMRCMAEREVNKESIPMPMDVTNKIQAVVCYFYLGWAIVDLLVTAAFIHLLYTSLASLRKAHWHLAALCIRSTGIAILAVVGVVSSKPFVREAQINFALAASACFLVVRAFRGLILSGNTTTPIYPSREGENSGRRARLSLRHASKVPSTSSRQQINTLDDDSDDGVDDIELETIHPAGSLKSIGQSGALE